MNESTACTFKKKYESELDDAKRQGRAKPTSIPLKPQQYILAASNRGNVTSQNIAVSAAKVIMERYPCLIGSIDIESLHWAQFVPQDGFPLLPSYNIKARNSRRCFERNQNVISS